MKLRILNILFLTLITMISNAEEIIVTNNIYELNIEQSKCSFIIKELKTGKSLDFSPTFLVLYNPAANSSKPKMESIQSIEGINYFAPSWNDNFDLFASGGVRLRSAIGVEQIDDRTFKFKYDNKGEFEIESKLYLPEGDKDPVLSVELNILQDGCFSVGYYGARAYDILDVEELWQPLVWTDRILPNKSFLTPSCLCTLPAVMSRVQDCTYGVTCTTWTTKFTSLPKFSNSNYGVAIRNNAGKVQPMMFAPILGGLGSDMSAGDNFVFDYSLFVSVKDISRLCCDISKRIFLFDRFPRNNHLCSLNETFENMLDYGMSEYSQFYSNLKGSSYNTDVRNSVRNTSALHPLNIAFVTDNIDVFQKRALPVMEFMLSRNSDLFALEPTSGAGGQTAGNSLGEPCVRSSEASALFELTNRRSSFLKEIAEEKKAANLPLSHEKMWRDNFSLFTATNDTSYIEDACSGAISYINHRIENLLSSFSYDDHSVSSFWSAYNPKWIELFEMYEITGNQQFLDAAYEGALRFCRFLWQLPVVPDSKITVNKGGKAPVYNSKGPAMQVPEESVDAWTLSEAGLHTEASGTCLSHRAVFMANHAPYMLKIAALKEDNFLRDMARSAVIGRYMNFPGYHINTDRTTVYEKIDFPLHSPEEITSTSMHYSHVWPMISLLLDYLVSDAEALSEGNIDFHSQFVEAFAYLQGRTYYGYGDFYDVDSVTLYMPKQLLTGGDKQLNYISARKGNILCLSFTNQSDKSVSAEYLINDDYIKTCSSTLVKSYTNNVQGNDALVNGRSINVTVPPYGMVSLIIDGIELKSELQGEMLAESELWQNDYVDIEGGPTGKGMVLNFGNELKYAYIYSSDAKDTYDNIVLEYSIDGGDYKIMTDNEYPFEFEVKLPSQSSSIEFRLKSEDAVSEMAILSKDKVVRAIMSDDDKFLMQGEKAGIVVSLEGEAPWSLSYLLNENLKHIDNIQTNSFVIDDIIDTNSVLKLIDVSDKNKSGTVSLGEKRIYLSDKILYPVFDTYVQEKSESDNSGKKYLELKYSQGWSREVFISFNLSDLDRDYAKYGLRFNLEDIDSSNKTPISIMENCHIYDNSLIWNNRDDFSFKEFGSVYVSEAEKGLFVDIDITDLIKEILSDNEKSVSFRLELPNLGATLVKLCSSENSIEESPAILCIDDISVNFDNVSSSEVLVYPTVLENDLFYIYNAEDIVKTDVYTVSGEMVYHKKYDDNCFTKKVECDNLEKGVYVVVLYTEDSFCIKKIIRI